MAAVTQGFVANIVLTLGNIALGIVTARYLGAQGRGELAALTTLPAFFSFVMSMGLPSALIYHARQDDAQAGSGLMGTALLLSAIAGVLGSAIAYVVAPHVLKELPASLMPAAQALAVFTLLGIISQLTMAALQAKHEFLAFNRIRIAQPLGQLLGVGLFAVAGWLTPLTAALIAMLAGLPSLIWSVGWVWRTYRPHWKQMTVSLRHLGSYSSRAYGGELLLGLANQLDKVIVVGIFSPATMGMYVVALSLSRVVAIFSSAVVPVLFPKASGRSEPDVLHITSKAAAMTALLVSVTSAALFVLGPLLLRVVYGAEFGNAALSFRLLVAEAAVASVVQVMSQAFMALNRPGLVSLQYGSGAVVAVPLLFWLAPRYGSDGAACALLLASLARLACTYWCFSGVMRVATPRVFGGMGQSIVTLRSALRAAIR